MLTSPRDPSRSAYKQKESNNIMEERKDEGKEEGIEVEKGIGKEGNTGRKE